MADEQKLVQSALAEYKSQNFTECLDRLCQLVTLKPNDPKILHNKALIEFLLSGCKAVDAYQKAINEICSQLHLDMKQPDVPEEVDHGILYYNQAMLYCLQKQYDAALEIAKKAFILIQPLGDTLLHKVCLLLLELNIHLKDVDNALTFLTYIENQVVTISPIIRKISDSKPQETQPSVDNATDSFKIKLLHYRAKCYLMNKSYDLCSKDIDAIYTTGKPDFSTIVLASHLEVLEHNYEKALDLLIVVQEDLKKFEELDSLQKIIFFNNIGSIYHYLGKPNLSYFYMSKAYNIFKNNITKFSKVVSKDLSPDMPQIFKPEQVQKFVYNVGVSCLFCSKYDTAFELFTEAVQVMHTSALVWLRLAECCIAANKPDIKQIFNFSKRRVEIVSHVIGVGPSRKLILNNELYKDSCYSFEPQSYAIPVPTLDFATMCVRNALKLLPEGNKKLKHAVLAASAYVHLCIGDPSQALKYCVMLKNEETSSDMYKYLSRLYMAEAFLMLDRVADATEVLNPTHLKELDPSSERNLHDWYPDSYLNVLTIAQYNLAVVLTIKGDLDKASELLKYIWVTRGPSEEVPIHVISLAIYIEMVLGHMDIVKTIIQQNCSHLFVTC